MGDRAAKDALFDEFAAVGKALANPKRLELLDLLAQGRRSVDDVAGAAGLGLSTCSAHLQALREAGLVTSQRDGKRIFYALSGNDVAELWDLLRRVAQRHRPHTEVARRAYLGSDDIEAVATEDLLRRARQGEVVILDVRPAPEYRAAHLPGAIHIPLDELGARFAELPAGREVVAYCRGRYCVLAHDAVRLLERHGFNARRAAEGMLEWRITGVAVESAA
ncbi:ArsR/SmtB family transcription factor [Candidatus Mycolicibacterium alkanivorans]|uniref:Metalloregulator ArsR/SmtB family transcription factor n=1 Tax=Candidatus Mycolicibacterium alkanivorans TaxID=2954114 RepID=A0ABS9YYR0_9MYCO|nr:metalloregulator ArsR/SmtB family transcription factor [Candidatus Mycolicibacterium alkanivorans]MCI4676223.1 metalloregulator ArsR/SmtB family transcription factor [Candidatus Mycolicibacterium alkanivorans]